MGNVAASCAPSIVSSGGAAAASKVLFGDGRIEMYNKPVKAGELMVENPGQFICDPTHLKVGQRIPGLSADEELELRTQLYFLLPMEMLYSVLTNEELRSLTCRASKALTMKKQRLVSSFNFLCHHDHHSCMFPNYSSSDQAKTLVLDNPEPLIKSCSRQRSWIPALETIVETPPRRL